MLKFTLIQMDVHHQIIHIKYVKKTLKRVYKLKEYL